MANKYLPAFGDVSNTDAEMNLCRADEQEQNEQPNAVETAMFMFWTSIADSHPDIKFGDLSPDQMFTFEQCCYTAVTQWLNANNRTNGQTATNWADK